MPLGIDREGLAEPLRAFHARGAPIFGTCAGLIMLDRAHLGLMDIVASATRSAASCTPSRRTSSSPTSKAVQCARCSSARRGSRSTGPGWRCSRRSAAIRSPRARGRCWRSPSIPSSATTGACTPRSSSRCGRRAARAPRRADAMCVDHVTYACADLDAAAALVEADLGIAVAGGGRHAGIGTHNRIVPLGGGYLELLAVADAREAAASPLGAAVQARIAAAGGGLMGWGVAVDAVEPVAARLGTAISTISRSGLTARLTGVAEAMREPFLPFFIARDPGVADPGAGADARGGAGGGGGGGAGRAPRPARGGRAPRAGGGAGPRG